ncbi:MAG: DUF5318 family protein [Gordonia sp. (in: high G+C Gram-positive bacteria)]|uniref:DUF5318 family protein n=1 Tax=Gordonia sp. (in: high G+C Gram-positive bacteria) TaxID=84139 RepID=UPI003BB4A00C
MHRQVVDFALTKRSKLADVRTGRVGLNEVCDADDCLLRAAQFHGLGLAEPCPVCRKELLTEVSWVVGSSLGRTSGSARTPAEIARLAARLPDFSVHVVEVCRTCHWNHLRRTYVVGLGPDVARHRRAGT